MFTGIVEELGRVLSVESREDTVRLRVAASTAREGSDVGASVAVSGVCLTVVEVDAEALGFDVGPETLRVTTLGTLGPGSAVNLERPLRLGGALGGHLVLGHVDAVGTIAAVTRSGAAARVRVAVGDAELLPLLIPKGSVTVDGVSLTVAELDDAGFEIMVIPHTLAVTTLGRVVPGDRVNLEMDVVGKYVARALALRGS